MIQLIVDVYNSRIDRNGNTYWAYVVTDVRSGAYVQSLLGGSARGNAQHIIRELGYEWSDFHLTEHELPIRQFDRMVKGWPHISDGTSLLAAFHDEGVDISYSRYPRGR